jgi:lysophospholipase L1-like esterase
LTIVAAASATIGAVCIGAAGGATTLWPVLVLALAGIILLALSLLWVNDRLSDEIAEGPTRWLAFFFLGLSAFGLGFLGVSVWWDSLVLGVIGTVTLASGFIGLHVLWKRQASESDGELVQLWFAVELIAGGIGVIWALDSFTAWAWIGLLVWFLGLIAVKQTMAASLAAGAVSVSRTLRISVDVAIVGFLALLGGATTSNQLAVMIGIAGVFVGCSLFGMAMMYVRMDHRRAVLVTAAGIGILLGGWVWARWVFGFAGLAALLTALVAVVGAWFVFRGEAIILVVFVGFVAVWGLSDDPSRVAADPNPAAGARILALGDSFISGEGADEYFDGTNRVGLGRNECRRAPTAHPYLVAEHLGMGLDFVACSGATTADLFTCGQMTAGPNRCRPEEIGPVDPDAAPGALPQMSNLGAAELADVDVVLLSIGGNDVGFSTIVQACLLPRSCDERSAGWLANVEALGDTLVDTYTAVRATVPGTPVIVVPYPMLVDAGPCDLGLDRAEHRFVIDFIDALDDRIEASAVEAGVHVYAAARDAFAGHRLCDDRPGANHLDLDPPNGSPTARYLPSTWIHNSMHPNPDGHRLLAFGSLTDTSGGLQAFVAERLAAAKADPAMANPEPVAPPEDGTDGSGVPGGDPGTGEVAAEATQEVVIEAEAEQAAELLSDGQWITDELYRTIRKLLVPSLLLLIGSITFAIGFVNLDLPGARLVRPQRTWRLRREP